MREVDTIKEFDLLAHLLICILNLPYSTLALQWNVPAKAPSEG